MQTPVRNTLVPRLAHYHLSAFAIQSVLQWCRNELVQVCLMGMSNLLRHRCIGEMYIAGEDEDIMLTACQDFYQFVPGGREDGPVIEAGSASKPLLDAPKLSSQPAQRCNAALQESYTHEIFRNPDQWWKQYWY